MKNTKNTKSNSKSLKKKGKGKNTPVVKNNIKKVKDVPKDEEESEEEEEVIPQSIRSSKKVVSKKGKFLKASPSSKTDNKTDNKNKIGSKKKEKILAQKKTNGVKAKDKKDDKSDDIKKRDSPVKITKNQKKSAKIIVSSDDESEDEDKDKIDKSNHITVVSKGGAVVDKFFPDSSKYFVVQDKHSEFNGKFFDATLNFSDLKNNSNKFYLFQLLCEDNTSNYTLFTRWGRVGYDKNKSIEKCISLEKGIQSFMKKYDEKTKKGYNLVVIDYTKNEEKEESKVDKKKVKKKKDEVVKVQSSLANQVKDLMELIYNINIMNQQMTEIGYDAIKLPLGKLGKETLTQGYEILKEIEKVLDGKMKGDLYVLSSSFYSKIPHNFGFKNMANFVINDKIKLKSKVDMIQSLSDIEIATKILEEKTDQDVDLYESHYKKLSCEINHIHNSHNIYSTLETYLHNSSSDNTHQNLELIDAYELKRHGEHEKYKHELGNKKLLWHGSRITNFVGILSQGLRIAPPEAPTSGYLFGKGLYFADMASKSACYCYPSNGVGILLLCEVALGTPHELLTTDHDAANLPNGKHSTKGCGQTVPSEEIEIDSVKIPIGLPTKGNLKTYLGYNEFIVYNSNQVKMRYLLKVRFNSGKNYK